MRNKNTRAIKQIEDICRGNGLSMDNLADELKRIKEKKEYERILKSVEDSTKLVGRYFKGRDLEGDIFKNGVKPMCGKEMIFYKVVSDRADHVGEVECIIFSQTPHISFRAERHLLWQPSDGIVGHYSYCGIHNGAVSKQEIESLTEISEEEFETAAKKHLNMLLESEWQAIADPYIVISFDDE